MPVTLDLSALKTPSRNGDVLIEPGFSSFGKMVESNMTRAQGYDFLVCGVPYRDYRRVVREGNDLPTDRPALAMGHQPEFYHCGVWAKSVVCQGLAETLGAEGVNVMIDHDKIRSPYLQVPVVESGRVCVKHIPIQERVAAAVYEQMPCWSGDDVDRFARQLEEACGGANDSSLMAPFLDIFSQAKAPRDWVSQYVFATRHVDRSFGIALRYLRAGQIDFGCYYADLINNARRFANSYNAALATYRLNKRIKGTRHPIPDLHVDGEKVELPLWITDTQGLRRRLHVGDGAGRIQICADREVLESYSGSDFESWNTAEACLDDLATTHQLRPRALAFTIWARLFLSDFFIHGIGGAKYDQIADLIIEDYFGIEPPKFSCVSATMWLDLPRYEVKRDDLLGVRRGLRDTRYNPQRYAVDSEAARELILEREQLVRESLRLRREAPRDRVARSGAFQALRSLNERLVGYCAVQLVDAGERSAMLEWQLKSNVFANSREYSYCLFPRARLVELQDRLRDAMDRA